MAWRDPGMAGGAPAVGARPVAAAAAPINPEVSSWTQPNPIAAARAAPRRDPATEGPS
jgi:hypothetical protein